MNYRLFKKEFGVNKTSIICDINIAHQINGLCHIEGFGFLFLLRDNHCLGYLDYFGKIKIPWMGQIDKCGDIDGIKTVALLNYPSSICYFKPNNSCIVIEKGGSRVREITINSLYVLSLIKGSIIKEIDKYFLKVKDINLLQTSCDVDNQRKIYWAVSDLNRCFSLESNRIENLIGNGHSGYAVSHDLNHCRLNYPFGLVCVNGYILFADTKNYCIRKIFNGQVSIEAGKPLIKGEDGLLNNPSQIKKIKNSIYFLDGNKIKYMSVDKKINIVYESENIVFIETGSKKELYIIEREGL